MNPGTSHTSWDGKTRTFVSLELLLKNWTIIIKYVCGYTLHFLPILSHKSWVFQLLNFQWLLGLRGAVGLRVLCLVHCPQCTRQSLMGRRTNISCSYSPTLAKACLTIIAISSMWQPHFACVRRSWNVIQFRCGKRQDTKIQRCV